jgi:UDP-glucose 4-epimerase
VALYAITGGAGFIGSHLADFLLAEGHDIRILDDLSTGKIENVDPRAELLRGDVADPAAVALLLHGATGCFHLAAIASVARSNEEWLAVHRVNQAGTVAVLDGARRSAGLPVVYASSAAVYGTVEGVAHEGLVPAPQTAYGVDKYGSELHARIGFAVHRVPSIGLRFFNVFGPRQDPSSPYSGVISIFARKMAEGAPITVHGDGKQTRDFVFVSDVVAHLVASMRQIAAQPAADVLNVCTGREITILDLVAALGRLWNKTPAVTHGPARAGDIRRSIGSPERAMAILGIRAEVTLDEGLRAIFQESKEPAARSLVEP